MLCKIFEPCSGNTEVYHIKPPMTVRITHQYTEYVSSACGQNGKIFDEKRKGPQK